MRNLQVSQRITNRETHVTDRYLNEISRIPLLSQEDEIELARKIRKGDKVAADNMIRGNLRFVVSIAKKYQNLGMPLSDLINEGNIGLIRAAYKFDDTRGFKFISVAVWWIRQAILAALADQKRVIRLPVNKQSLLFKTRQASDQLEMRLERQPSQNELAEFMEVDESWLFEGLYDTGQTFSYDAPLANSDGDFTLLDKLGDKERGVSERLSDESDRYLINRLLAKLTTREHTIIELNFGLSGKEPLAPKDIGECLGISTERVRQLRKSALSRMAGMTSDKEGLFY
ncbi:sigma-70 family RNA polymerase sigma factor [Pedobacter sp. HMF7647]|uniref:Sigma-70 family RNA polymerase sigma factor n=1 Tax=Hufsiella arboris TaxID=2695275 RepID=A0A7K1Y5U8_9SPHI|nr:sigma-70 family RNA polymerase sigma factor [Hufsiella arboris]MXV49952.1 sigma-70 family RNA polymerase sigma factor [Hufsiella arboris]